MIEIKMMIEKLWLKESYTKVCFMFLCNIWRIVQEAIFCSLTALSHTVLWEEWVDVFDLGFFFSFNFYFFILLNPKRQVIFFLLFPKNVNWTVYEIFGGFSDGWNGMESSCNEWVGKIPWRRKWQPTPVFLPRKSHAQRSLAGYSLWGGKESDTTEWLTHTNTWNI